MRSLFVNVAALVLGFVALALWNGRQRQAEMEQTSHDMAELSRSVEQRVAETSSALQRVEQAIQARVNEKEKTPAGGPAEATPAAPPPPAVPEPREITEHVEAAFYQEAVDRDWSLQATRTLKNNLAEILPEKSSLRSLECHASLCRLELVHPGDQQQQQFLSRTGLSKSLWQGATMTYGTEGPGGTFVTISYLAREGHELPFPGRPPRQDR